MIHEALHGCLITIHTLCGANTVSTIQSHHQQCKHRGPDIQSPQQKHKLLFQKRTCARNAASSASLTAACCFVASSCISASGSTTVCTTGAGGASAAALTAPVDTAGRVAVASGAASTALGSFGCACAVLPASGMASEAARHRGTLHLWPQLQQHCYTCVAIARHAHFACWMAADDPAGPWRANVKY